MLTPETVIALGEPITKVYEACTDQILINIARHFKIKDNGGTQTEWQMRKLTELAQCNKENIAIVAKLTGQNEELVFAALWKAQENALKDIAPILQGAEAANKISKIPLSQNVATVLKNYSDQAVDKYNLVNAVMLDSGQQAYRKIVSNTIAWENQAMSKMTAEMAQETLNAQTGITALGINSRRQAVEDSVKKMAQNGLTGFVDRGGHHWSPEAYVNMDIRTTVHNTSVQSRKTRSAEYGVNTFQITTVAAARPLCAPYQGKVYSWVRGDSGTVYDLDGTAYQYSSIYDTSYGQPAGMFGINCLHSPVTFVSGYSMPRYEPLETEAEKETNDKAYQESQQQRYLERQVRYAKRDAAIADAQGDKELFDKAALKVKQKQAEYKSFVKSTGRTARLDRTQVNGYNRSVSGKVTGSAKHNFNNN